ncbi:DUF2339 domain-containing protein [Flavobacterium daemonense]|uniref:DUF2339 domain-containing protein n=1 Tax=Flavobacterium daemonense TaxID=1393049 RepID=UPI0011851C1F|nr:DUF2339 domain-containing protein [Flavobacterium daemonense]KAF2327325.1 DUF2339 domain-containing protein [Flavobacterium daemonense]
MNYQSSGNPKPFAIIGLVFAILALLFSMIPCVGYYAVGPSFFALAFSGISYLGLKQKNESTSVPLAGLIIGVAAFSIGIFQYYKYETVYATKAEIEKSINEAQTEVLDTIQKKVLEKTEQKLKEEIAKDSILQLKKDSIQKIKNDSVSK